MAYEENRYVSELQLLLEQYRSTKRAVVTLEIIVAFVAVVVAVGLSVFFGRVAGYLVALVIASVTILCLDKLGFSFKHAPFTKGQLAYRVCSIMDELIYIKETDGNTPDECRILTVGSGRHVGLYNRFVSLYPALASKDLEKLANIEVSIKDLYN